MARVALIQDGTEVTRQAQADVESLFTTISRGLGHQVSAFVDASVKHLFDGISPDDYGCLVFASNSLLVHGGPVHGAFEAHAADLRRYVEAGGAVVVLHQGTPTPVLEQLFGVEVQLTTTQRASGRWRKRWSPRALRVSASGADESVLHFPHRVDPDDERRYREDKECRWMQGLPLYYRAFPHDGLHGFRPVLETDDGVLLACADRRTIGNVILCTMPLDWAGDGELLRNVMHEALNGPPRCLLDRVTGAERDDLDGMHALLSGRAGTARFETGAIQSGADARSSWLLRQADAVVFDTVERLERSWANGAMRSFVALGGTLMAAETLVLEDEQVVVSRVSAYVGGRRSRDASRLFADALSAADDWLRGPFEIRNIVVALKALDTRFGDERGRWRTAYERAQSRAADGYSDFNQRFDVGSRLMFAETLLALGTPVAVTALPELGEVERPDARLQLQALRAAETGGEPRRAWLRDAAAVIGGGVSAGQLARILNGYALLERHGGIDAGDEYEAFVTVSEAALEQLPWDDDNGWMSVEATAAIAIAVARLQRRTDAAGGPFTHHLSRCARLLDTALGRAENGAGTLGYIARLTEALLEVEQVFPLVVDHLSSLLDPLMPGGNGVTDGIDPRSQILAQRNATLSDRLTGLSEELVAAARLGRWTAATALTAALVVLVACVVLGLVFFAEAQWEVATALLAFVVTAGAPLWVTAARFLHRRHLLPPILRRLVREIPG